VSDGSPSGSARGRRRTRAWLPIAIAIVALIVVVASALLIRLAPGSALGRLATVPQLARLTTSPPADGTNPIDQQSTDDQVQFLRFVVGDIQDSWEQQFQSANLTYQRTQLVLFQDEVRSACGPTTAETGPFYCPGDQHVYLDVSFFRELANQLGAPGDFAEAYVVAHEFGHHVQDLLGITTQVAQLESADPTISNDLSVRTELQADCLAGIWGHSAYEQSLLESGDLDEAINAAAAVGDDRLQRQANGRVDPDTFTHGTSAQRVAWFVAGFQSGDPSRCDTFQQDMPVATSSSSLR
jgi:hypothetical protein